MLSGKPRVVVEYMQVAYQPKRIILPGNYDGPLGERDIVWDWETVQKEWPFVNSLEDLMDNERLYENA